MFNKKNDPLVESVKAVMKENEFRRQAEAALNEELGISSKKALPHEYHTQYDALLEAKVVDAEDREVKREKLMRHMRPIRALTSKLPKMKKNDKEDDFYKERVKREIPEEAQMSPKQKKLAMLGNTAGKGGNPNKIDEPDLNAARKGHAHKVGLEEKAVSQQQQKFFGLVSAIKKGKAKGSPEAEKVAKEMSAKEVRKFAKTKHEGLPKRVDEAEGDVDPSTMTPISKGLQGRIVKDPPLPTPAPKKMEEGVAMDRASAAVKMAYGTTKQPRTRIGAAQKEPNETTVGVMKSFLRRQEKKKDKPVAESVIDEIRENLEANLIAIHESGDEELFENYINSLTEEELDILGLSEDWRANAFGDNTSGGSLSNFGYRTPPSIAAAQARGAARTARRPEPAASAVRPASTPTAAPKPTTTSSTAMPTSKINIGTGEGIAPKLSMPTSAPSVPSPRADSFVPNEKEANPLKLPTKAPDVGEPPAVQSSSVRPGPSLAQQAQQRRSGQNPAPANLNVAMQGLDEQTKPQIKESLESFVRNRFLKG